MSGDIVNFRPQTEVEQLRRKLIAANERIENLEYEAAERSAAMALAQTVEHNQVWFIRLTPKEAMCMSLLCKAAPRVLTKRAMMQGLYSAEDEPAEKIVDVFVCKLRAKLAAIGLDVATEWGRGYRIAPADARSWERWCALTASGQVPPPDFKIIPARTEYRTSLGRHWADFSRDVDMVHGAIETGEPVSKVLHETGRPPAFVKAVERGLALGQTEDGDDADITELKPEGRSREQVIEAAVSQTIAELGVTLPHTARRAAEIAVDLMTAEVMSIAAEVEE